MRGPMATSLLLLSTPLPPFIAPLPLRRLCLRAAGSLSVAPSTDLSARSSLALWLPSKRPRFGTARASVEEALVPEVVAENAQEMVPAADGGIASVLVSGLVTLAFVGLSVLTAGVIYIAVTDYLQKRDNDKFVKEEAAKKPKGKKKVKVKPGNRPRGFGQKVEVEEEEDL